MLSVEESTPPLWVGLEGCDEGAARIQVRIYLPGDMTSSGTVQVAMPQFPWTTFLQEGLSQ